jgi:hypothetical protein
VVLINAIDEHHFNSVHRLPVRLAMRARTLGETAIEFSNTAPVEGTSLARRAIARAYRGPLTYSMTYFHGSTGTVTLGPDALHFHVMFALRPTPDGRTEGQTVLLTRRRRGPLGFLWSGAVLGLTRLVAAYFARGDTRVFRSIRFALGVPVAADRPILEFIRHTERQPTAAWGPPEREGTRAARPDALGGPDGNGASTAVAAPDRRGDVPLPAGRG